MTAPNKIWAFHALELAEENAVGDILAHDTEQYGGHEYTLTALSQAQVAAAYEAGMIEAADICDVVAKRNENHPVNWAHNCAAFIRIAANELDATAAMQAMIDKAVAEERERCAQVCDAVSLSAHLAIGLAGDDEITTRVGAASYAKAAERIASDIRKDAKP
jgi:hypothetical protein